MYFFPNFTDVLEVAAMAVGNLTAFGGDQKLNWQSSPHFSGFISSKDWFLWKIPTYPLEHTQGALTTCL